MHRPPVAYAANGNLNASHTRLLTYEKIEDFEDLSLIGKVYVPSRMGVQAHWLRVFPRIK